MSRQQKAIRDYLTHLDILKHHGVSDLHEKYGHTEQETYTPDIQPIQKYTPRRIGATTAIATFIQSETTLRDEILASQDLILYKKIVAAMGYKENDVSILSYQDTEFEKDTFLTNLHSQVKIVVFLNESFHQLALSWSGEKQLPWNLFNENDFSFHFSRIPNFSEMNANPSLKKNAWEILQIFKI